MNKTYVINDEVKAYQDAVASLGENPNLFTLISAIKSAFDANVALSNVVDLVGQLPAERFSLGDMNFIMHLSINYKLPERLKLESLSKISSLAAISEVLWQLLEPWNLEEIWSDKGCLYSINQFAKYSSSDAPKIIAPTSSPSEMSDASKFGYKWAKEKEELISQSQSKELSDVSRASGYPYVPWAIFIKEFLDEEYRLSDDLKRLSSLIETYYLPQPSPVKKPLRTEDRLSFCKLYGGILRIALYENLRLPIGQDNTFDRFICFAVGIKDLHADAKAVKGSSASLFDYFLCIQNLLILCACLDVDPLVNKFVTEAELKREHFKDYTAGQLENVIIEPSLFLELVFLPPTAALRVFEVWNPYEGEEFDASTVLSVANFGVEALEVDYDRFHSSLNEHLCYSNEDEKAVEFFSPLQQRVENLVGSWVFPLRILDELNKHCKFNLLTDVNVRANIKHALREQEVACEFKETLPSSWLGCEFPPYLDVSEDMHPMLAALPTININSHIRSRPNEWLVVVESFINYGFLKPGATLLSLALISQGKLNRHGTRDPFDHHRLSKIVRSFSPALFRSRISHALNLYIKLSGDCLLLPVQELISDLVSSDSRGERKNYLALVQSEQIEVEHELDGKISKFSFGSREMLRGVVVRLGEKRYDRIFDANAIVLNFATAIENELRTRLGNDWKKDNVRDELTRAPIGFDYKKGPAGLKCFANILRNFKGFQEVTKTALKGLSPLANHNKCDDVIAKLKEIAELSNTRHGNPKDFNNNKQVTGRADHVRKILFESDFLSCFSETAVSS